VSVPSASDWRKIERLLRKVASEVHSQRDKEEQKKLSNTMHHFAIKASLLQHENERLKEARRIGAGAGLLILSGEI
jgi:cell division protein YceG involved in septum cleavage